MRLGTTFAVILILGLISGTASATLIQIQAQGTVDDAFANSDQYIALGTLVNLSLQIDVSGSAPGFPTIGSVSGSLTWNDGTARTLTATSINGLASLSAAGFYFKEFGATGPVINTITGTGIGVVFDIGTNPFTSTDSWDSLLLNASISEFGFGGSFIGGGGFVCGSCIGENVSGRISLVSVPEPSALTLLGAGLLGFGFARRRLRSVR